MLPARLNALLVSIKVKDGVHMCATNHSKSTQGPLFRRKSALLSAFLTLRASPVLIHIQRTNGKGHGAPACCDRMQRSVDLHGNTTHSMTWSDGNHVAKILNEWISERLAHPPCAVVIHTHKEGLYIPLIIGHIRYTTVFGAALDVQTTLHAFCTPLFNTFLFPLSLFFFISFHFPSLTCTPSFFFSRILVFLYYTYIQYGSTNE